MSLENATKISELVATNPPGTDPVSQGDDHIRMIKNVLQQNAIKSEIGQSATPANNFTLDASADNGTLKLARATGQEILTVDASGRVKLPQTTIVFTGREAGPTSAGFSLTLLTDIVAETNLGDGWNASTDRFQPTIAGWYQFNMRVLGTTSSAANYFVARIAKNTGGVGNELNAAAAPYLTLYGQPVISGIFYMNGTTDYVQFLVDAAGGAGTLNWSDAYVSAALIAN